MKRLLALLCSLALVFCLLPSTAFAEGGNGNIDGGGGSMGQGTSSNFWNPGNDGVRITVVDADSGTAISSPVDFSNRVQKNSVLHFGKVNKLQYLGGTALSLQSGVAYSCIKPAQSMPTIVSSKGQSNIEAIKRYFCSEYACQMVAQAAGVDYERMIAGDYKLLIEPIAYFTHNGQYYCMTATEAALYDQKSSGALRKTMTSLTHKNLPLSMFLEFSDLGLPAWTGSTTSKQSNADIISSLGVGIVWFDERPPEGEIEAPDVEYRVDTDVITSVTLRTDTDLTPDNPASVTFHTMPSVIGFLDKNVRISVDKTPIVDPEVGINASIRIVNQQTVSAQKLLDSGSATAEMLHFLTACIRYGVSVCIAGATGSGKTTIMAWLLSQVPDNRRLITIEEGSREFDLVKRDENGNILNSVVHLLTRPSENPSLNINQDFLLERVLRKHPDVIGVGEMRSAAESLSAAESSRTGHTAPKSTLTAALLLTGA